MADSFSFGVEREMKESGEKGGTAYLNIGIGELQEATSGDANLDGKVDSEDLNATRKEEALHHLLKAYDLNPN